MFLNSLFVECLGQFNGQFIYKSRVRVSFKISDHRVLLHTIRNNIYLYCVVRSCLTTSVPIKTEITRDTLTYFVTVGNEGIFPHKLFTFRPFRMEKFCQLVFHVNIDQTLSVNSVFSCSQQKLYENYTNARFGNQIIKYIL